MHNFILLGVVVLGIIAFRASRRRRTRVSALESRYGPLLNEVLKTAKEYARVEPLGPLDGLLLEAHSIISLLPAIQDEIDELASRDTDVQPASVRLYARREICVKLGRVRRLKRAMDEVLADTQTALQDPS
jgi:hypothetical protein